MQRGNKRVKKADLPSKICVTCGLSFSWRKKWENVWSEVRYCSVRCRREKRFNEAEMAKE